MAVKVRLRQQGCRNKRSYRIVVTDSRNRRDGKYIESLGWYDPLAKNKDRLLSLDEGRLLFWLSKGAILTEKTKYLVKRSIPDIDHKVGRSVSGEEK